MIAVTLIKGVNCGLEYFDHHLFGFGVNMDLGILRLTWYKDIVRVDGPFEEEEDEKE